MLCRSGAFRVAGGWMKTVRRGHEAAIIEFARQIAANVKQLGGNKQHHRVEREKLHGKQ